MQDIMKSHCVFLTYRELCVKFDCVFTSMEYNSLLSAIPWKRIISADINASKPIGTVSYDNKIMQKKLKPCYQQNIHRCMCKAGLTLHGF